MSGKIWWRLKLLFVVFLVGVAFQLLTMFSTEQMKDNENHIQSFNAVRLRNDENEVPVVIVDQHQEGLFSKLLAQTRSEKIPNILTF